jgi:hypothetical protein
MERTGDWSRVVLDAGPFFRFGSTGPLLDLIKYLGTKAAISREIEEEVLRNALKPKYAFLRVVQLLRPPIDAIDLSPKGAEELRDRARAASRPGDHPNKHKGEISSVLLAVELAPAIVVCDDDLGKRLAKKKEVPRLSTPQLAAEMVAVGELSYEAGEAVFVATAGNADPRHFRNTVREARAAQTR